MNTLSLSVGRLIKTLMRVWVCSGSFFNDQTHLCYFRLYCMDFVLYLVTGTTGGRGRGGGGGMTESHTQGAQHPPVHASISVDINSS